jgi:hypothetical protein
MERLVIPGHSQRTRGVTFATSNRGRTIMSQTQIAAREAEMKTSKQAMRESRRRKTPPRVSRARVRNSTGITAPAWAASAVSGTACLTPTSLEEDAPPAEEEDLDEGYVLEDEDEELEKEEEEDEGLGPLGGGDEDY